jgi:hypothetical protein
MSINGPQDNYQTYVGTGVSSSSHLKAQAQPPESSDKVVTHNSAQPRVDISDAASLALSIERDYGVELKGLSLSEEQLSQLQGLFGELQGIKDASLEAGGQRPSLTEARQRELQALDDKIMEIYAGAENNPLSAPKARYLDELFQQADSILGHPPVSPEQQTQIEAIHRQIDSIFNSSFDAKALDGEIEQLESLFQQRDDLILNQELTPEQEEQVVEIEAQIELLLSSDSQGEDPERLDSLFEALESVLGNPPLTDQQQTQLRKLDDSIFNSLDSVDWSGMSLGEQQQLQELFNRADKILGRPVLSENQNPRVEEINQQIEQLLTPGTENNRVPGYSV